MLTLKLALTVLKDDLTIHRFPISHTIPHQVYESGFYSISKTDEELSIVCSSSILLDSEKSENGWSGIKVAGPLDFSLTGILANISSILADAKISIFAVSTFDTDYILIKSTKLSLAIDALQAAGHNVQES